MKRLRVVDFNTPWFWITVFYYGKRYGKPYFDLSIWSPNKWTRWWLNVWQWENTPETEKAYAAQ